MSQAKTTTDHEGVKRWIEERQDRPTVVKGTEGQDGEGLLRVDFREPDFQAGRDFLGRVLPDL